MNGVIRNGVFDVSSTDSFGLNVRKPEFRQATEFIKQLNDARVIDPAAHLAEYEQLLEAA